MRQHDSAEQFRLLYVEDTPSDVSLVRMALADFSPKVTLTAVGTGAEALLYLNQQGEYAGVQRPHLILLDLNLPGTSGEEVLLTIKSDQNLKALPVVVFSSAADEINCKTVYQDNANTCVTKPFDLDLFFDTVQQTCRYWFTIANLPTSQQCHNARGRSHDATFHHDARPTAANVAGDARSA